MSAARKIRSFTAAAGLPLMLAACEGAVGDAFKDFSQGAVKLPCPRVAVLKDSDKRVQFAEGPGRYILDVDNEVLIEEIKQLCRSNIQRTTRAGSQELLIRVFFTSTRGPANRSKFAEFEYFIAVTGKSGKVLYREAFTASADFSGNETRVLVPGTRVLLEVPIKAGQTGRNFRVYVGLKLTREELAYNRELRLKEQTDGRNAAR